MNITVTCQRKALPKESTNEDLGRADNSYEPSMFLPLVRKMR
jgi:hypothetical protein